MTMVPDSCVSGIGTVSRYGEDFKVLAMLERRNFCSLRQIFYAILEPPNPIELPSILSQ
jgi:hypothetical protein